MTITTTISNGHKVYEFNEPPHDVPPGCTFSTAMFIGKTCYTLRIWPTRTISASNTKDGLEVKSKSNSMLCLMTNRSSISKEEYLLGNDLKGFEHSLYVNTASHFYLSFDEKIESSDVLKRGRLREAFITMAPLLIPEISEITAHQKMSLLSQINAIKEKTK